MMGVIFKDKLKIHHIHPDKLKPAEYNPRKKSPKKYEDLKKSIRRYGFAKPIVCNKYSGRENVVIGGHLRLMIAKELNFEEVPVVYVNLPEKSERELNLRLNKDLGEWDNDMLKLLGEDLLQHSGFNEHDIKSLFKEDNIVEKESKLRPKTDYIVIQFINKDEKLAFRQRLGIDKDTKSVDWKAVKEAFKISD
jgi:ParB-like chromosome segregation protein Spo0J